MRTIILARTFNMVQDYASDKKYDSRVVVYGNEVYKLQGYDRDTQVIVLPGAPDDILQYAKARFNNIKYDFV